MLEQYAARTEKKKNANAYKLFLVKRQCDFITWNTYASLEVQINGVS